MFCRRVRAFVRGAREKEAERTKKRRRNLIRWKQAAENLPGELFSWTKMGNTPFMCFLQVAAYTYIYTDVTYARDASLSVISSDMWARSLDKLCLWMTSRCVVYTTTRVHIHKSLRITFIVILIKNAIPHNERHLYQTFNDNLNGSSLHLPTLHISSRIHESFIPMKNNLILNIENLFIEKLIHWFITMY